MIVLIITLTLAVILVASFSLPMVKEKTNTVAYSETLTKINASNEENKTLTYTDIVSSSLSIAGLTITSNYTIDYDTGIVTFVAGSSLNGTYTASYNYYPSGYLTNSNERNLFGIIGLALIIGLLAWVFMSFGIDKS